MQREITVLNKMGLHARPAALIVRCANDYQAELTLAKDGEIVDCRSILGLITLSAGKGCKLTLHADGQDATQALDAIEKLFINKFDEE
ncbi:MAG: HPr family phosphocarrier protein [Lentisphaeria bacterium]|nr:HPr family phosphocarrier protein [Lentisphaeria bacterium]